MRIAEVHGYLIEATDPQFVVGVQIGWISSPNRMILGTGRGDNSNAAVMAAVRDAAENPSPNATQRDTAICRSILNALA